jgi:hypothetical protein
MTMCLELYPNYFLGAPWGGVLPPLAFSALGFLVFFLPFVPMTTSYLLLPLSQVFVFDLVLFIDEGGKPYRE